MPIIPIPVLFETRHARLKTGGASKTEFTARMAIMIRMGMGAAAKYPEFIRSLPVHLLRDRHDVEDLVLESWFAALMAAPTFRDARENG